MATLLCFHDTASRKGGVGIIFLTLLYSLTNRDLYVQVLACDIDLLHPTAEYEKRSHKLKRLVESPNSYFMDVKCQGCFSMYVYLNLMTCLVDIDKKSRSQICPQSRMRPLVR